jgi:hypothetical protein
VLVGQEQEQLPLLLLLHFTFSPRLPPPLVFYTALPSSPPTPMGLNRPSPLSQRCLPFFSPLNNRLGQNPCQVARELIDQCDGQQQEYYDLAPLNLDGGETRMRPPNPGQVSLASLSCD